MFSFISKLFSSEVEEKPYKPVIILCAVSLLIFSIGYALRPVSNIVDELHESNDE